MPTIASPVSLIDLDKLKTRWKHLEDLPIDVSGGQLDILFGSDVIHLTTAIETRIGKDYEPTASRTRIGWIVRGAIGEQHGQKAVRSNAIFITNDEVDTLAQQLKRFCDTEDFGNEHLIPGMSEVDRQAIQFL